MLNPPSPASVIGELGELAAFENDVRIKDVLYRASGMLRSIEQEQDNLRGELQEARNFENLLREILSIIPEDVQIIHKDMSLPGEDEIPQQGETIIAVGREGRFFFHGAWMVRLKDSIAWNAVRARDLVRAYDKRKEGLK